MAWLAALLFVSMAAYVLVKRRDVARGESLVFGGKMPIGCVVTQGVALLGIAIAFALLALSGSL